MKRRPPRRSAAAPPPIRYKIVETALVTDDELERLINEHVAAGWTFDGIQFAMREASKRPAMAFILFLSTDRDTGDLP